MSLAFALTAADRVVTYVRVDKPKLDVVQLILGAFTITGLLVALALILGTTFAITLILRRRREAPPSPALDLSRRPVDPSAR